MLSDPCNAGLTKSLYGGSGGGIVQRFDTDFTITNTDAAVIQFTPGAYAIRVAPNNNASSFTAYSAALLVGTSVGDTVGFDFKPPSYSTPNGSTQQIANAAYIVNVLPTAMTPPGLNFMQGVAGTYRALAACVQLTWLGKETDRAGTVFSYTGPADLLVDFRKLQSSYDDQITTAAQARSLCPSVERTPSGTYERKWAPQADDDEFRTVGASSTAGQVGATLADLPIFADETNYGGLGSIVAGFSGVGSTGAMRVRLVTVVEWVPGIKSSSIVTKPVPAPTRNTMNDVLVALDKTSPDWTLSSGVAVAVRTAKMLAPLML